MEKEKYYSPECDIVFLKGSSNFLLNTSTDVDPWDNGNEYGF